MGFIFSSGLKIIAIFSYLNKYMFEDLDLDFFLH